MVSQQTENGIILFFHRNQWNLMKNREKHFVKKNLMKKWNFWREMSNTLDRHRDTILCEIRISWDIIKYFISIGIPPQKLRYVKLNESVYVLHCSGDEESIQQLIEQGVDVNSQDQYSNNALNWATKKGEFLCFRSAISWLIAQFKCFF